MKIVVVGPKQSGKTSIANFLAAPNSQAIGSISEPYQPTSGTRILEFPLQSNDLELWDVSGDQRYENCWSAIMQGQKDGGSGSKEGIDGVVLVYNPEIPGQDQEVGLWYDQFVKNAGIPDSACIVFVHRVDPKGAYRSRAPPKLDSCVVHNTTFNSNSEIREHFEVFVNGLSGGGGGFNRK
jgi:Rab-like protein 5